uniref:Glucokinase n=1 Tax=Favella ehrenbergii TaxID=182087 RepID=A0A7S3I8B3_9SPIT|mmetsp:Transcript_38277/g.50206  ORF Transcript_38277/g.50206 Transcript_38277/m.50206 type:complete len:264 (+) Transcript_38277:484-1275(+)
MDKFELVNDFVAAGHGLLQLQEKDYERLNRSPIEEGGVKVVLGPGTGHGQGYLVKSKFSPCYEVYPSEGGHVEFAPRDEQDMRMLKFGFDFIETSDNVENKRAKAKLDRMSHERLGAGPAIPLIYEFMKKEYATLERILEVGENAKQPDDINSFDVIDAAMARKDPLCNKVVEKFSEIFAVQAGDTALKYLPYGGVYLVGGVTMSIRDKMLTEKSWINHFYNKGRLSNVMHRFPVMILKPETELGILGAEEVAYRLCGSYAAK